MKDQVGHIKSAIERLSIDGTWTHVRRMPRSELQASAENAYKGLVRAEEKKAVPLMQEMISCESQRSGEKSSTKASLANGVVACWSTSTVAKLHSPKADTN